MVLRLSEIYGSVQGEGPRTGTPTTFVRFGGCNLRCPGWPCDTEHAVDPKHYVEWKKTDARPILDRIPNYPQNVCITGGEPLLQDRNSLDELLQGLLDRKHTLEVFTNGTKPVGGFLAAYSAVTMDWKLKGSGHGDRDIDQRIQNIGILTQAPWPHEHGVKFVIKDYDDFEEAVNWWMHIQKTFPNNLQFWAGTVWGTMRDDFLVEKILQNRLPWRLNVQQHKHIWDPDKRAV